MAARALKERLTYYSDTVYVRGLIEISNICKNNCYYCGIRASNTHCDRYRLNEEEILLCCEEGYALGFRTFVLQGGEDYYFTSKRLGNIVSEIKKRCPDSAVTLSMGEMSEEDYRHLYNCGADRYLLRHESANSDHYSLLHPENMSYSNRISCLHTLRKIGYQTGCGFMVGSPHQTAKHLANDLKFIEEFAPHMCGIGPFIPHNETPFCNEKAGDADLTVYLLSIIRLIHPKILLPATTALGSLTHDGREKGILAGANVIMPNLSPQSVRAKYSLYNGKLHSGAESAQEIRLLSEKMESIGFRVVFERGDSKIDY